MERRNAPRGAGLSGQAWKPRGISAFKPPAGCEAARMPSAVTPEKTAELEARMAALGIGEGDLLEKFVRGSGAGGQKINKTSSCVFLKHLPSGVCVKCQMDRSREMNRFLARRELCDQLDAIREGRAVARTQAIEKMRRTNRPRSRNSKKRSVADKRELSRKKSLRQRPGAD
jgi:protein subunit release factor B